MHSHFRDCQQWKNESLELSTSSNEAAKLFDAAVTQYVGSCEDDQFGGFEGTFASLRQADPDFVMGHVITNALQLIGMSKTPRLDTKLRQQLIDMRCVADSAKSLTAREKLHVTAVEQLGNGHLDQACSTWEQILLDHPTDALAVRLAQDGYYHLGYVNQLRDCVARVLPEWTTDVPLYSYLFGMYAFGLCETRDFVQAETMARKALELNPFDSWATHALAHVLEMTGRHDEGLEFLNSTINNWKSSMFACHISWHSAVYHIEKAEYQAAVDIFDSTIVKSMLKTEAVFNVSDAASLLYRLQLEGFDVGSRWNHLQQLAVRHMNDHLTTFYDAHFLISLLGVSDEQRVSEFMHTVRDYISVSDATNKLVAQRVGLPLFEALIDFNSQRYNCVVEHLLPVKYDITDGLLNGSRAQKDMFVQMLIHAAIKSTVPQHRVLARHLLNERAALKRNSPLTDRLVSQLPPLTCSQK